MATTPMPSKEELPGNSHAERDAREEAANALAAKRQLQGTVNPEKQSLGKKIVSTFVKDDMNEVKEYVWYDVVLPKVKEIISETISNTVDMALYGERRSRSNINRRGGSSYVSYSSQYRSTNDSRPQYASGSRDRRDGYNLSNLIFDTRVDAESVLGDLCDLVEDYKMASVADFYKFAGMEEQSTFMDRRWGWYDLGNARVVRTRDGYSIDMPRPQQLDV
jgi:hypothetical protein